MIPGGPPDGIVRIHTSDMAIFMAREKRNDLPCAVSPNKPVLGFDLRFHSSYEVAVPLRALAGNGNLLTVLFRVTPVAHPDEPVFFRQRINVPPIEENASGDAYLQGAFDIGQGDYQVDWLMRDRMGRVCSSFWEVNAHLRGGDKTIRLNIEPSRIRQSELEQFKEEPPVVRSAAGGGLRVKLLVNFAPQNQHAATLQPMDTSALLAILRTISREPRIRKFSVVAFNLHEQRVLYREDNVDRINFPALGASLDTLQLGTIDLQRLSEKHGETEFLADLIRRELCSADGLDACVIAGPKAMLSRGVSEEELSSLGDLDFPVYYMNYNLYPHRIPWRDTIGNAVKFLGGKEYTISRPRDLWNAVTEVVSQIEKNKQERQVVASSSE